MVGDGGAEGDANLQGITTWQKQKLKQINFKVGNFTDFKAFFSRCDDGFSLNVPCQKLKNLRMVCFSNWGV